MLITYTCVECDKKFKKYEHENAKFCSRDCQDGSIDEKFNILGKRLKLSGVDVKPPKER